LDKCVVLLKSWCYTFKTRDKKETMSKKTHLFSAMKFALRCLLVLHIVVIAGCASNTYVKDGATAQIEPNRDPLESLNRVTFSVNSYADKLVAQPIARTYRSIVPAVARQGVTNVMSNLHEPNNFANNILQAKFKDAFLTALRFALNSTIGIGGLFDLAKESGLEKKRTTFGDTLKSWGVKGGPYLIIPIWGPSNFPDAVGRAVDYVMDPINIWTYASDDYSYISYIRTGVEALDDRTNMLDATTSLEKGSLDYYAAMRSAYYQYRDNWASSSSGGAEGSTADEYERLLSEDKQ
jgi:phospholipid-binding lipoprotein MlaA